MRLHLKRNANKKFRSDNYNPLMNLVAKGVNVTGHINLEIPGNKTIVVTIATVETEAYNEARSLLNNDTV